MTSWMGEIGLLSPKKVLWLLARDTDMGLLMSQIFDFVARGRLDNNEKFLAVGTVVWVGWKAATLALCCSAILDVEDLIQGHYNLEVSSPGVNRPLFTEEQFRRYQKAMIHVRMHSSTDGRRNYTGELIQVADHHLTLRVDEQEFRLAIENIEKAHLV